MKDGFYKWGEFRAEVFGLMPLEKDRLIQGDDGQFLERLLKLAVIDLQKYVRPYRTNHETLYLPSDFVSELHASHAVLPPNAALRDVWLFELARNRRYPLIEFPWELRFEMVTERMNVKDNNGRIAIDPQCYTFYVYPEVKAGWMVSMFWDGIKTSFKECEETPFDTLAVEAAAEYVQGKLSRTVQNDMALYSSFFHPSTGSYTVKRKDCYLNAKERGQISL